MSNAPRTAETFRKLLAKMTKPQFMGACAKHNVNWVDGPRAPMIEQIITNAFPAPVIVPEAPVVVAVAANVAEAPATNAAGSDTIEGLLGKLRSATSPLVKKQLRRKLRAAGHRGGLGGAEQPAV